jgi:hypothetical protein
MLSLSYALRTMKSPVKISAWTKSDISIRAYSPLWSNA